MGKTNYAIIKENAFNKLVIMEEGPLSEDSISITLNAIRSVIESHGIEVYKHLLGPITGNLTNEEWEEIILGGVEKRNTIMMVIIGINIGSLS